MAYRISVTGSQPSVVVVSGLSISTSSTLTNGNQGSILTPVTFTAIGGTPPYTWRQLGGAVNPWTNGDTYVQPTGGLNVSYAGVLAGTPLANAETNSFPVQVTDSAIPPASTQKTFNVTTTSAAFNTTVLGSTNQFASSIDAVDQRYFYNINMWGGQPGYTNTYIKAWSPRNFVIHQPITYTVTGGGFIGFPFAMRGWYKGMTPGYFASTGTSAAAPLVSSGILISSLTGSGTGKFQYRIVLEQPIDRTVTADDTLCDLYIHSISNPTGGGDQHTNTDPNNPLCNILLCPNWINTGNGFSAVIRNINWSSSYFTGHIDNGSGGAGTQLTITSFATPALNGGYLQIGQTLSPGPAPSGPASPAAGTQIIGFVSGTYGGVGVYTVQTSQLTASGTMVGKVGPPTYVSSSTGGQVTLDGKVWYYQLSNSTQFAQYPPVTGTYNSIVLIPAPWNDGQQAGLKYLYGDYGQLVKDLIASPIGSLLPFTASSYVSNFGIGVEGNGYTTNVDTWIKDFQTAILSEADIVIPVTQECGTLISRGLPTADSGAVGGNGSDKANTANYNADWFYSATTPSVGSPVYVAYNCNSVSSALKKNGFVILQNVSGGHYASTSFGYLGDFTIDVNPSVSGTYPTTGWVTMRPYTGNVEAKLGLYIGDWSANGGWIRMNCTAGAVTNAGGIGSIYNFKMDVYNSPRTSGLSDGIKHFGDSISAKTMQAAQCEADDGSIGAQADYAGNTLRNYTGRHHPWIGCGVSGWSLTGAWNSVATTSTVTGSGYTNGGYTNVQMQGGTGILCAVNVTVSGGVPSITSIPNPGYGFTVSDVLTPVIGQLPGGSGFSFTVASITTSGYTSVIPFFAGFRGPSWLDNWGGRDAIFAFGTNDLLGAGVTQLIFQSGLAWTANRCIANGQNAIMPTVFYSMGDAGVTSNNGSAYIKNLTNLAITGITNAAQAQVTLSYLSTIHPLAVGQECLFGGVVGMTQINGSPGLVQSIGGSSGAWTATFNINSSGFGAFSGTGTPILTRTKVIDGPDLNTWGNTYQKAIFLPAVDTIHPNGYGAAWFRTYWVDWMGRRQYLGQPASTIQFDCSIGLGAGGN